MPEISGGRAELLTVPMSDSGTLSVLRYASGNTAAPAVLQITPYRKEVGPKEAWRLAARGYNVLKADVRGFGGSRGPYSGIFSDREIQDGVELIDWIARRPFCNGKVALIGGSYTGANQMLIAARRPKAMACIAPGVGPVDTYRDWNWRGGMPTFVGWGMNYFKAWREDIRQAGLQDYYFRLVADGLDGPQHRERSPEYGLSQIEVPTFLIGGWDDYFLRGTIRSYLSIPARRRLLVGPWGHPNHGDSEEDGRWLDYWLKGEGKDPTAAPSVRLFRTGSEEWIERDRWFDYARAAWWTWKPFDRPAEAPVAPTFNGIPAPENVRSVFDSASGFSHWPELMTVDSRPFDKPVDIDGHPALEAFVEAGPCADLEFHVRLSVVKADGTVRQLTEGRLRASHRAIDPQRCIRNAEGCVIVPWHTHERRERLAPGQSARLNLEINPLCHHFFPGERLRLGISLVRADDEDAPCTARLGADTRILLPMTTGVD